MHYSHVTITKVHLSALLTGLSKVQSQCTIYRSQWPKVHVSVLCKGPYDQRAKAHLSALLKGNQKAAKVKVKVKFKVKKKSKAC